MYNIDYFLQAVGWWNFAGSLAMMGFLYEPFGKKMLNEWTGIFSTPFTVDYWGKVWLFWAAGINIFFGLINILAVYWNYPEVKSFLVISDIVAYCIFILLAIWGHIAGRMGSGIYSVYVIFSGWITWAVLTLI